MRIVKYVLIAVAVLIVGIVVAVMTMDFGVLKGEIQQAAFDATGRKLAIEGKLHLSPFPTPTLLAEKVRFANAPWGSAPDMVKVDKVEARVALMPLLTQKIVVERLVLNAPEILIETDRQGRSNLEFEPVQPATGPPGQPTKPAPPGTGTTPQIPVLNDVTLEKGRITQRDGKTGKATVLALDRLNIRGAGAGVPLQVELAGEYDGKKFDISGTLGSLAELSGTKPWPIDVKARAGGAEMTAKGSIAKPMEAKGIDLAFAAEGKDLTEFGKFAGAALPALGAYKMTANVAGPSSDGWTIKNLHLTVGKSTISGQATIDPERTPLKLTARLETPELDLAALKGASPAPAQSAAPKTGPEALRPASKPAGDGRIFDNSPLPLDVLKAVDADVSVSAKRVVDNKLVLNDASLILALARGKLAIQPLKAVIAGGAVDAKVTLDAAPATPELAIEASAKDIDANTLLTQLGQAGMVENAKAGLHANLKGRGKSMREMMASLDGTMGVVTGPGRIGSKYVDAMGADLVKLFALSGGNVSQLNCIAAPFTVQAGVARTNAILFDTARVTVRGEGDVNLRDERVNLLLTPKPKDPALVSLAVPVRVTGSLASPAVAPDTFSVAKGVAGAVIGTAINPLGLLVPLVSSGSGESNPCATGAAARGPAQPQQPAQQQQPGRGGVQQQLDNMERSIRGLFGR
jgi:uncharacterized protein involved in outer membrane biogenesis